MRSSLPLLLALPLFLGACGDGGGDATALTQSGYDALGRSDWAAAVEDFDAALAAIGGDTGHSQYMRAKLGSLRAKAHQDPASAREDCMAMAEAGQVTDRDFAMVGGYLLEARQLTEAIDLMDAGRKKYFPESAHLKTLQERLVAEAASDEEAAEQLRGLGYL